MRKITSHALVALAVGLVLGGCASTTSPYGNFVQASALDQQKIAADAVQQLVTLYAPARTRLELQQPTPDPFGQALVQSLRDKGYAIVEFAPAAKPQAASATVPTAPASAATSDGLPVRYVLDQAGDSNLYRLTLMVGAQTLTRPYLAQNGSSVPAGYWVRKE